MKTICSLLIFASALFACFTTQLFAAEPNEKAEVTARIREINAELRDLRIGINNETIDLDKAEARMAALKGELQSITPKSESDPATEKKEKALAEKERKLKDEQNVAGRIEDRIKWLQTNSGVEVNKRVADEEINRLRLDLRDAQNKASVTEKEYNTMQAQKAGLLDGAAKKSKASGK